MEHYLKVSYKHYNLNVYASICNADYECYLLFFLGIQKAIRNDFLVMVQMYVRIYVSYALIILLFNPYFSV